MDGRTIARAEENVMNATTFLADNDSYRFFSKLGDLMVTALTGTNMNDIAAIVAMKPLK